MGKRRRSPNVGLCPHDLDNKHRHGCPEDFRKKWTQIERVHCSDLLDVGENINETSVVDNEITFECKYSECNKPIHAYAYEGKITFNYTHWLERYLDYPQLHIYERNNARLGPPATWQLLNFFRTLALSALFTLFMVLLIYGYYSSLTILNLYYILFYFISIVIYIQFYYYILRNIKIKIGRVERFFESEYGNLFLKKQFNRYYNWSGLVTILFLLFLYGIAWLDNTEIQHHVMDVATIGLKLFHATGYGIFLSFFLLYLSVDVSNPNGNFFILRSRIDDLSNIAIQIVVVVSLMVAFNTLGQWFLTGDLVIRETFLFYYIILPILGILAIFIAYSIVIIRLQRRIKMRELGNIDPEIEKIRISDKEFHANLQDYLIIRAKIEDDRAWSLNPRIMAQLAFALVLALSPLLIELIIRHLSQ